MRVKLLIGILLLIAFIMFAAKEVTIWIGGHAAELSKTWKTVIKRFEETTGIKVKYQLIGFEIYFDKLVAAFQAGEAPDVAFADLGGWVPTFAEKGWLEPLDERLKNWEGTKQIWENLWPTVTYKGVRYGVPWYTDCRLLLYHKEMLKQAGLDPNKPPKYWEDLLIAAMKITDPDKRIYGYGVSGIKSEITTLGYMIFLYGAGGKLLTDDYSRAAFDTPEGIRALRFYTNLAKLVSPNAILYGEDDYRNMMAQGKVAMAIGGPWSFPLIEQVNPDIKGKYSVAIHPYAVKPASVLGGWALVINKNSPRKEEAWELIKFLTSYDTWMYWVEQEGGPMPARKDVCFDSPVFKGDPRWQIILETFPHAVARPPVPQWPQISEQIQIMVQNVLLGKKTPEEAVHEAAEKINEILGAK